MFMEIIALRNPVIVCDLLAGSIVIAFASLLLSLTGVAHLPQMGEPEHAPASEQLVLLEERWSTELPVIHHTRLCLEHREAGGMVVPSAEEYLLSECITR